MSAREREGRANGYHLTGRPANAANALRARATGRCEYHLLHPARVGAHRPGPGELLLQGDARTAGGIDRDRIASWEILRYPLQTPLFLRLCMGLSSKAATSLISSGT